MKCKQKNVRLIPLYFHTQKKKRIVLKQIYLYGLIFFGCYKSSCNFAVNAGDASCNYLGRYTRRKAFNTISQDTSMQIR